MGISSSDIANSTANAAQDKLRDYEVLVPWLIGRIEALERGAGISPPEREELFSERSRRLQAEFLAQVRKDGWPSYGIASIRALASEEEKG